METDTVAIIGPQSSDVAHVISHLANELHVPLLSFTALDSTLSHLQYPFFIQTAPNDLYQMSAIADIVSYFRFREVIAVYTDNDQSRNSITILGDKLVEKRCKLAYKAQLPADPPPSYELVMAQLTKITLMESRVIVVNTYPKAGLLVFELAQKLGMMDRGYVWIATTWLSSLIDSDWLTPESVNSMQGVLTLRHHTTDSKRKRDFASRWGKLSNGSIGLNTYGLYAYDTVWIIANAIKVFLENGDTISFSNDPRLTDFDVGGTLNLCALSIFDGGQQLLRYILQTNMTGLSGPNRFNQDRSMTHPAYDILNVVGSGFRQIGYWSNYSGLSVAPPETLENKPVNRSSSSQQLHSVVWAGRTEVQPRGWVFPHNGRELRIGVPNRVSYKDFVTVNKSTGVVSGFCIDVFHAAIKLLPYAVPHKFVLFGDGQKNPGYTDLVKMIPANVCIVTLVCRVLDGCFLSFCTLFVI